MSTCENAVNCLFISIACNIVNLYLMDFYSGYMSPEYAIDGVYSIKSDVFSFGVLVLEIISGKRNRGFNHPDHELNLLGHVSIK